MKKDRSHIKARRQAKLEKAGNTLFNVGMGGSFARSYVGRFRNHQSTNDTSTYNPFEKVLAATGADDF